MMTPTAAKRALERKAGTLQGMYYSVGVQVPPKKGSSFGMRYTSVPSARAGAQLLRRRLLRKRVGMVGEVIVAIAHTHHSVSLGGYIRRAGGVLEPFDGDGRGALDRVKHLSRSRE